MESKFSSRTLTHWLRLSGVVDKPAWTGALGWIINIASSTEIEAPKADTSILDFVCVEPVNKDSNSANTG